MEIKKKMKKIVFPLVAVFLVTGCGTPKFPTQPLESDYYRLSTKKVKQVSDSIKKSMAELGGERDTQKRAIQDIQSYGVYAIPMLLLVLEAGSPQQQTGAKECLKALVKGKSEVYYMFEATDKDNPPVRRVSNRDILASHYLNHLEMGYNQLTTMHWRSPAMKQNNQVRNVKSIRFLYRINLCELFADVGTPQYMNRFFNAIDNDEDISSQVRAMGYRSIGKMGQKMAVPKLIRVYQYEDDGVARFAIWNSLTKLTNLDYPDMPKIWKAWLNKQEGDTE